MKRWAAASGSITLCYHAISSTWHDPLAVTPAAFERQIRSLLARGLTPVTAEQAVNGKPGTFHVTFDDCFTSIRGSLELLRALGVSATVFACSGYATRGERLLLPELNERATGFEHEFETMTWDGLREESRSGIAVGSHTVSHAHLPLLSDSELFDELTVSRQQIEDELGVPCPLVAYPFGESDARVRRAAARAGYACGFEVESGTGGDLMSVPRVGVYRGTGPARFWSMTHPAGRSLRGGVAALRRASARSALARDGHAAARAELDEANRTREHDLLRTTGAVEVDVRAAQDGR